MPPLQIDVNKTRNAFILFTSICCESVLQLVPTVVQQLTTCRLTQRVARSLGGSRASCTWKHDSKLFKRRLRLDVRKFVFSNRVMNSWNSLPTQFVNCNTVDTLKKYVSVALESEIDVNS